MAFAVLATALFGGRAYFYCAPMQRVAFDACCAGHGVADEEPATIAIDETHRCCETRTFAPGEAGSSAGATAVVPLAPLASVLPAVRWIPTHVVAAVARVRTHDTRAGPPPSSPLAFRVPVDVSRS